MKTTLRKPPPTLLDLLRKKYRKRSLALGLRRTVLMRRKARMILAKWRDEG